MRKRPGVKFRFLSGKMKDICRGSAIRMGNGHPLSVVVTLFAVAVGVFVLWSVFYSLGRVLVHVPSRVVPDGIAGLLLDKP
ncbi:MAG: hypothetical protein GYA56_07205 [Geobacteraceae bacterium]|nr:hypothetical protein [Geobacteraceae bacterium]